MKCPGNSIEVSQTYLMEFWVFSDLGGLLSDFITQPVNIISPSEYGICSLLGYCFLLACFLLAGINSYLSGCRLLERMCSGLSSSFLAFLLSLEWRANVVYLYGSFCLLKTFYSTLVGLCPVVMP